MLKIINAPNSVLSEKAKPVTVVEKDGKKIAKLDKEILRLIEQMKQTLLSAKDPEGVGLAAPQVGKSLRIFLMKPTPKAPISVFINPVIIAQKNAEQHTEEDTDSVVERKVSRNSKPSTRLEGCLSLPDIWGVVKRFPALTLSYFDEKGKYREKEFKGFQATIIQHETDHLNGILFPKRVLEQNEKLYKSEKNEKGQDEFEEIKL